MRKVLSAALPAALIASLAIGMPLGAAHAAEGTVSLGALDTAVTQDFDTLATTGPASTVPEGWYFAEAGTNANTTYSAGTGSGNAGDTYSFGAAGSTERAFGGLLSGSLTPTIGAGFTNETGATVTALEVAYTGEQWRLGALGRPDRLDAQWSADATSLTTGTWSDIDSLDFTAPVTGDAIGARDGNAAPNRTQIAGSLTDLSLAPGATIWLRWTDVNAAGSDDGLAIDDFSITARSDGAPDAAPAVTATFPVDGAADFPVAANLTVTFSEPVDLTDPWYTLDCSVSGGVAASVTGGPTVFTLDPTSDLSAGESCTLTVLAAQVSDQDANDPPDTMASDVSATFTAVDVCTAAFTPIPQIQGAGAAAAITGAVTTQGVVVADIEGTAAGSGFYLQDPIGDGDPATSDGIFVFTGAADLVSVGDEVRVTGFARERFNQTTINGADSNTAAVTDVTLCGTGAIEPIDVTLPFASATEPERYEGMLVRFPQPLVIAEYFNYDRFGEIVLAQPLPGETRPFTPTAVEEPGVDAQARAAANLLSRITLDDNQSAQNPPVLRHPNGLPFSLENRFRGGDTVANTTGVLGWDFSLYRVFPTQGADYTAVNPRPTTPDEVGGSLRVAAMNALNYFVTPDYPSGPLDNACGPANDVECRGWDADQPAELERQRAKLLAALDGLDADVIGLNEIENTAGVEALADIAAGLPGYSYVETGTIGTDAIKVGLLYRTAAVTPVGDPAILTTADDPRFLDTKSRPPLAQTFEVTDTGARFTAVVNHLKSKGSDCNDVGDPDIGDGQGNCNQTRTAAAEAIVDWLATDPTGSGDEDFLILGDLNSYAKEDPIDVILAGADGILGTDDDYRNLIEQFQGRFAYSYTFDGQAGYLDHAIASATLAGQVTGATEWHINSDEPDVLDYDTSFKPAAQDALYEPNAYRASDHDPVVVGLELRANQAPVVDAGGPYTVVEGGTVTLTATGSDPDGDALTFAWDLDGDGTFETPGAEVAFAPSAAAPAVLTVAVQATDPDGLSTIASTTVQVRYPFEGFFNPVKNLPAVNAVKAVQAVPVKFSLGGDRGLQVLEGVPTVTLSVCGTSTVIGEVPVSINGPALSYDARSDTYSFVWKTSKSFAGTCGVLTLTFDDGSTRQASFRFN